MTNKELLHIISQGENEQVEFKSTFNQDAILSLTAFANKKGGKVIIGISDAGKFIDIGINQESIQNWIQCQ